MNSLAAQQPVPAHVAAALDKVDLSGNAWITVTPNEAVRAGRRAPATARLSGMTFAVKDNFDTAGIRTTYGSPMYVDHFPRHTATIVRELETAGAVNIGKTNMNEFAYGVTGFNPTFGLITSPLDEHRTASGSSGGSAAAVATRTVDFALGSDTSGSVRLPAACCGVVGFKAAHGALPMDGVYPLAPAFDSLGVLTRDISTLRRVLGVTELPDAGSAVVANIDDLGLPGLPSSHGVLFRQQAYALHKQRSMLNPSGYSQDLLCKLSIEDRMSHEDAIVEWTSWRATYVSLVHNVDLLVGPVFDGPPPTVHQMLDEYATNSQETSARLIRRTAVANALGWPALAIPTALGPKEILGRPGSEPLMLAVAQKIMGQQ
jgi:Asp-tRNA(Asn)/Glu-tRNA(Gln) amidotransferase A subunit family amidase